MHRPLSVLRVLILVVTCATGSVEARGSSLGPTAVWLLESCVSIGSVKLGLPGVAAQFFFASPIPTIRDVIRTGTTGQLPMLPYSSMFSSGFLWGTYGLLQENPAIWAPNLPAIVLGFVFTVIFAMHAPKEANWLPGTVRMHIVGAALSCAFVLSLAIMLDTESAAFALGWYGTIVVVIMFYGPLAAMKTVLDTQSTRSLPLTMTIATFVNCILWTVYGWSVVDDFFVWFPNGLGLASSLVQFGLFGIFGVDSADDVVRSPDDSTKAQKVF